jgi:hypothetical protein
MSNSPEKYGLNMVNQMKFMGFDDF